MLSVLRISVAVLASAVAAVALQATSAASTVSAVATPDTCAFTTTGHKCESPAHQYLPNQDVPAYESDRF